MEEFVKLAKLSDVVEGRGMVRRFAGDEIAFVKLNESILAFVNVCPHQHNPLVDKYGGQIAGNELTCPMHGWTYDLRTGECVNVPPCPKGIHSDGIPHSNEMSIMSGKSGKLKMLDVKVEDGVVLVRMPSEKTNW